MDRFERMLTSWHSPREDSLFVRHISYPSRAGVYTTYLGEFRAMLPNALSNFSRHVKIGSSSFKSLNGLVVRAH